jgi:predicted secreted protein
MQDSSLFSRVASLSGACIVAATMSVAHAQGTAPASPATSAPAPTESSAGAGPRLTLHASASSQVKQDTVVITISTDIEAPDQSEAGKKLNTVLDELTQRAKGVQDVDVRTGGYSVWPTSNNKGKIVSWHGQGQLVLQSTNFDAASALANKLSDKSAISNIGFTLSSKSRSATERDLLAQAAQAFRDRALAAASAFGFSGYRIVKLELSGQGAAPPMPVRAMAMAKSAVVAPAPDVPLEPDTITVSSEISGTVVLQ